LRVCAKTERMHRAHVYYDCSRPEFERISTQ
jgi:hypothetical protein